MTAAYIQSAQGAAYTQFASINVTLPSNVTAGNLILVTLGWAISGTPHILSDNQSNVYSPATNVAEVADWKRCRIYYTYAGSSGSLTVTYAANGVAGEDVQVGVFEYSGVSGAPEAATTSTTSDANCAITTSTNHALIVATGVAFSDPGVGSGWTGREYLTSYTFQRVVDKLDASPVGSFTGQFTSADAKCAAAFTPVGAGSITTTLALTEAADSAALAGAVTVGTLAFNCVERGDAAAVAGVGAPGIVFLQSKTGTSGGTQGTALHVTFDNPSSAGNLLVAVVEWSFSGTPIVITSDPALTWLPATPAVEYGDYRRGRIFYAYAAGSTQYDVIFNATGVVGEFIQLSAFEYYGPTGGPEASATSTTSDGNVAITTLSNHALVVATGIALADPGIGSGWTSRAYVSVYSPQRIVDKTDATPAGVFTGQFSSADAKAAAAFTSQFVGPTTITLALQDAADSASVAGANIVTGAGVGAEAADVAALTGFNTAAASLDVQENGDSAVIDGVTIILGTLDVQGSPDTTAITGDAFANATLDLQETADSFVIHGASTSTDAALALQDAADSADVFAWLVLTAYFGIEDVTVGGISLGEAADSVSIGVLTSRLAALAIQDAADRCSIDGVPTKSAALVLQEAADSCGVSGTNIVTAALDVLEAADGSHVTAAISGPSVLSSFMFAPLAMGG